MIVYISLGSNLGDSKQHIRQAIEAIAQLPHTFVRQSSSLYKTRAVGPVAQADFINAAIEIQTTLSANDLLGALQTIELAHERERNEQWGPRTLDLDMLLYGDFCSQEPGLCLPHPRMHERAFVLIPLIEIAPTLRIPGRNESIQALLAQCAHDQVVVRISGSSS